MDWLGKLSEAEHAEWRRWADHQEGVVFPAMKDSRVILSIAPPGKPDAKFCAETGMALLLGKPIILIVGRGMAIPGKLRLVADEVIEVNLDDPADAAEAGKKVAAAMARLGKD